MYFVVVKNGVIMRKIICDACVSKGLVEELRNEFGDSTEVIYVSEKNAYGTYGSMPDSSVMRLGWYLDAFIITANRKHYTAYDKLIPIPSRKNTRILMNEVRKYLS